MGFKPMTFLVLIRYSNHCRSYWELYGKLGHNLGYSYEYEQLSDQSIGLEHGKSWVGIPSGTQNFFTLLPCEQSLLLPPPKQRRLAGLQGITLLVILLYFICISKYIIICLFLSTRVVCLEWSLLTWLLFYFQIMRAYSSQL